MKPWFIATERLGPGDADKWAKYVEWSGLVQTTELITLDVILCPPVLEEISDEFWPHIVNQDYLLNYFTDLDFLRQALCTSDNFNLLVVRNPSSDIDRPPVDGFDFVGYDLVEDQTGVSALTNCGGFPDVFSNAELSEKGLLRDFERAVQVRSQLRSAHPEEPHANCEFC